MVRGDVELDIVLAGPNPQILYWFAMPFTTPMPWEAVAYYDGKDGRPNFSDHAVGTGAFRLAVYERQHRFVLERNLNWYGTLRPEAKAPGATFPTQIDQADIDAGRIDPAYAGRALPFLDRINFSREREGIPRFNKFLQGYYDDGGIIKESFDAIVKDDRLSPEMVARGMRLDTEVEPTVFYVGFNMEDGVVGAPAGHRSRNLRQAMSLAINVEDYLRLFLNGRGVPAQSPLPPGIFGYHKDYRNPFRQPDLPRARALLAEAGYKNGIDPATGQPLKLTFDTGNTSAQALLQYEFFVSAWRELGLDVQIKATTYNQFQDRVRRGAYQIFQWGWVADFPDPENFLFLLECGNAQSKSRGPNTANFCNADYDRLYREMKNLPNNDRRAGLIKQMVADRRDRAALDRALPQRGLQSEPRLARQFKADGHLQSGLQVQGREACDAGTAARGMEHTRALALVPRAAADRGSNRARRENLLSGAPLDGRLSHPPSGLWGGDRAGRAVPALHPLLHRNGPGRHRPQGRGREGSA